MARLMEKDALLSPERFWKRAASPRPCFKSLSREKADHLFLSLTKDFLTNLQGLSYLRFHYCIKNTLVLSYEVP